MPRDSVLEIIAYGAWSGGTLVDNSQYQQRGMVFKGGIPVTNKTIEERIGVRNSHCVAISTFLSNFAPSLFVASRVLSNEGWRLCLSK